jgi:hypothetical protein
MATGQAIGSAGELVAQARLLVRGWVVGNINSGGMMNAPSIDLFAAKGKHIIGIAVKATGHNSSHVQWNAKYGWITLFKGETKPNFVIFVWFDNKDVLDSCRVFVVPAEVVDREVRHAHEYWYKHSKRDGSQRKQSNHVAISWLGQDTDTNISHDFQEKWKEYEDAWEQLEPQPIPTRSSQAASRSHRKPPG